MQGQISWLDLSLGWPATSEFSKQIEGFYLEVLASYQEYISSSTSTSQQVECLPWLPALCSKAGLQGLCWVLSPTQWSESLWFLAGTSLRGSYTWVWHQRRWNSSLNATWIMRTNLVQQKVSWLLKEQHLSMWRPRVPLLTPKYGTRKSRET